MNKTVFKIAKSTAQHLKTLLNACHEHAKGSKSHAQLMGDFEIAVAILKIGMSYLENIEDPEYFYRYGQCLRKLALQAFNHILLSRDYVSKHDIASAVSVLTSTLSMMKKCYISPNPETQDFDSSIDYTDPKELGTFLNRLWKLKSESFIDGSNIEKFSEKWLNRMLDFLKDVEQVEQENFLWILGKYAGKGLDESERYDIDTIAYNVENHGIMDSLTAFGLLMNRPWPEFENLFDDDDDEKE